MNMVRFAGVCSLFFAAVSLGLIVKQIELVSDSSVETNSILFFCFAPLSAVGAADLL